MVFCSKFFGQKGKYDRHTKHCTGISGITYSFNTENLVTFKQRLCSENDFTFVAYCDFETSTKVQYDIENHVAYPVSYVLPLAFHPDQDQRGFGHSINQICNVFFLPRGVL